MITETCLLRGERFYWWGRIGSNEHLLAGCLSWQGCPARKFPRR